MLDMNLELAMDVDENLKFEVLEAGLFRGRQTENT